MPTETDGGTTWLTRLRRAGRGSEPTPRVRSAILLFERPGRRVLHEGLLASFEGYHIRTSGPILARRAPAGTRRPGPPGTPSGPRLHGRDQLGSLGVVRGVRHARERD